MRIVEAGELLERQATGGDIGTAKEHQPIGECLVRDREMLKHHQRGGGEAKVGFHRVREEALDVLLARLLSHAADRLKCGRPDLDGMGRQDAIPEDGLGPRVTEGGEQPDRGRLRRNGKIGLGLFQQLQELLAERLLLRGTERRHLADERAHGGLDDAGILIAEELDGGRVGAGMAGRAECGRDIAA